VEEAGLPGVPFATNGNYERYAEAAGLLLREDIPSTLTKLDNPLVRAEQFAQEELADIESHLALNRWESLRPRLQVQRAILSSLNRQGRVVGLIVRIDAQLERIAQLEAQREQAELQKACGRLISEVERFCTVTDLHQADREFEEFEDRLEQLRTGLATAAGGDMTILLDDLFARVQGHQRRLRRLEIRRAIREPLRHLRRHWPTDWAVPVSESVYQTLAQCAVSDPEGLVRDWAALEERLNAHQGQYYFHRVLSALQANSMSWDAVSGDLVEALRLRPDLWPAMGPLFGLSGGTTPGRQEMTPEMRVSLATAVKRLFAAGPEEEDACRASAHRAAGVLEQTLRRIEGEKWLRLWTQIEATLTPLLARTEIEAISQAQMLAERCLDAWPAGRPGPPGPADPRNPVNLFLESCAKARCLVEAEQSLHARPPRYAEAQKRFLEAVESGMDTEDQIRRIVTGLYLAGFHEKDAPQVQRHVLAGLEAWCRTVSEQTGQRLRQRDVVEAIAQVREKILAGRSVTEVKRTSLGGSLPHEAEGAWAGRSSGEGDPDADRGDTSKEGVTPEI
jgi:phage shock protein A